MSHCANPFSQATVAEAGKNEHRNFTGKTQNVQFFILRDREHPVCGMTEVSSISTQR
jgi:hypothetical protein